MTRFIFGLEYEFFVKEQDQLDKIIALLQNRINKEKLKIHKIGKELISKQYDLYQLEISLPPMTKSQNIVALQKLKDIIANTIITEVKEFSSLHINISLYDKNKQNMLINEDIKHYAIAGLMSNINKDIRLFLPDNFSNNRIACSFFTPSNISWGYNNRSTMLRFVTPKSQLQNSYIEHRLAINYVDIESVLNAIERHIQDGIKHKLTPPPAIYGNAFDRQYKGHIENFILKNN